MTEVEYRSWQQFYAESPFDDLHRYHRPAAMLAHVQVGGDFSNRLDWLIGAQNESHEEQSESFAGRFSEADLKTFAAFGLVLSK